MFLIESSVPNSLLYIIPEDPTPVFDIVMVTIASSMINDL